MIVLIQEVNIVLLIQINLAIRCIEKPKRIK